MAIFLIWQVEFILGEQTNRSVRIGSSGTFGVVPQGPHLVSGSVLEKVSLLSDEGTGVQRLTAVPVRAALEKLTADWQSRVIRPESGQLSVGELQRLILARALYRNTKILFLDDNTAMEIETELGVSKV